MKPLDRLIVYMGALSVALFTLGMVLASRMPSEQTTPTTSSVTYGTWFEGFAVLEPTSTSQVPVIPGSQANRSTTQSAQEAAPIVQDAQEGVTTSRPPTPTTLADIKEVRPETSQTTGKPSPITTVIDSTTTTIERTTQTYTSSPTSPKPTSTGTVPITPSTTLVPSTTGTTNPRPTTSSTGDIIAHPTF